MKDPILPSQIRAARNLLEWSQEQLAAEAGLGLSTVRDFEAGRRDAKVENIDAMRQALTKAGILFIEEDGDGGPGLRLASDVPKIIRAPTRVDGFRGVLPFKVKWRGEDIFVSVPQDVLDDLDRANYSNDVEFVASFNRHQALILRKIKRAIYARRVEDGWLRLRSGDFFAYV